MLTKLPNVIITLCLLILHSLMGSTMSGRLNDTSWNQSFIATPASELINVPVGGYWLNVGQQYDHCPSTLDSPNACKQFSWHAGPERARNLHAFNFPRLVERIVCTIQKVSCSLGEEPYQIHGIPCQTSCLALLKICRQYSSDRSQRTTCQIPGDWSIHPIYNTRRRSASSVGYHTPTTFVRRRMPRHVTAGDPSRVNRYGRNANTESNSYLSWSPSPNSGYGDSAAYNNHALYDHGTNNNPTTYYTRAEFNRRRRYSRRYGTSRYHNRPRPTYGSVRRRTPSASALAYNRPMQSDQMYSQATMSTTKPTSRTISEEDCKFLPAGGCDDWSDALFKNNYIYQSGQQLSTIDNPGCPAYSLHQCSRMFPTTFEENDWFGSNFTIAAVIRITETIWYFGKNNLFHPYVQFKVLKTLKSDIEPYDHTAILTFSWPMQCVCSKSLLTNRRYLLLTRSDQSRQTISLSTDSIFLSPVKFFRRRVMCWLGLCSQPEPLMPSYNQQLTSDWITFTKPV